MLRTDKQLESVTDSTRFELEGAPSGCWNLIRKVTIGRAPSELHAFYRDPSNLALIHAHYAEVKPLDDLRTQWKIGPVMGLALEWVAEIVEDIPGQLIRWKSLDGAGVKNEGWVRFTPAPRDWGTEVTLYVRYDPPAGVLGDAAAAMSTAMPKIVGDKALRRFKSLVETGEIATTAGQPAHRPGGRDRK